MTPVVINNYMVRSGQRETAASALPSDVQNVTLTMTTENWPVGGIDLGFLLSFDGGQTFVASKTPPYHIDKPVPNPREPLVQPPAIIGFGWGEEQTEPTHVKAWTNNPSSQFQTDVTIEGF